MTGGQSIKSRKQSIRFNDARGKILEKDSEFDLTCVIAGIGGRV